MIKSIVTFISVWLCLSLYAQTATNKLQQKFAEWRFGMFMYFEMGPFTNDDGWANNEFADPKVFDPKKLDCDQWADKAKSAEMTFVILTTRCHYSFGLWPTKFYDDYHVSYSPYKKDIIKQYVDAFRAKVIKPCFYYSIWNRHHKVEKGSISTEDLNYIKGQVTELPTNYRGIPLFIIDGWARHMGHKEVPFGEIRALIKKLQSNYLVIDHNGPSEIWEEPGERYYNFILNCRINRDGLFDSNIVSRLKEVGKSWKPDLSRPSLSVQDKVLEYPVSPVGAIASIRNAPTIIDGFSDSYGADNPIQTLWETTGKDTSTFITIDLRTVYNGIDMMTYLPRQHGTGKENTHEDITKYIIFYRTNSIKFKKASDGIWIKGKALKQAVFNWYKSGTFG
jgi:alpha-L-fucosidase